MRRKTSKFMPFLDAESASMVVYTKIMNYKAVILCAECSKLELADA